MTWAAHSYNIAFSDEIGHFDFCTKVDPATAACTGNEGLRNDQEPADADDVGCFPASASSLVQVSGCLGTNTGFDGAPYQPLWPDGIPNCIQRQSSCSPLTGQDYNVNYNRMAFETDLPRIEFTTCDRNAGTGCTLIPATDDGTPAVFYPFFSTHASSNGCVWGLGNHMPGDLNDFHQNQQYGTLLNLTYTTVRGGPTTRYNDFRQVFSNNPCPAGN